MSLLLLEDNAADAELIEYELRESLPDFVLKRVKTDGGYTNELLEPAPDLIPSGYDLPRYDGAQALSESRKKMPGFPLYSSDRSCN